MTRLRALSVDSSQSADRETLAIIAKLQADADKRAAELSNLIETATQFKEKISKLEKDAEAKRKKELAEKNGILAELDDANNFLRHGVKLVAGVPIVGPILGQFDSALGLAKQITKVIPDIYKEFPTMTPAKKVLALLFVNMMLAGTIIFITGILGLLGAITLSNPLLTIAAGATLAALGAYGARKLISSIKDARDPELANRLGILEQAFQALKKLFEMPGRALNYMFKRQDNTNKSAGSVVSPVEPTQEQNSSNTLRTPLLLAPA